MLWLLLVAIVLGSNSALQAQIAGYRVGSKGIDVRAIACEHNEPEDLLCRPSGDVYLRFRRGVLVEIDTSYSLTDTALVTAPDVWRRIQGRFIDRFGQPDSVRTMNALRLPKAFSGGLAAFWTKAGWCGVLTVKTIPGPDQAYVLSAIDITLEKLGTWGSENCSVFPFLVPSR